MDTTDRRIRPPGRIRLLWLIDSLTVGGAERLVPVFARHLDRERFDLQVACLKVIAGNPVATELEAMGVTVTVLGARNLRDIAAFRRLLQLIRHQRIEAIHTHLTYADIWGRLAGWLTGRPVLSTLHVVKYHQASHSRHPSGLIEAIAAFTRKRFGQTVIAVSDALRREQISRGMPPGRLAVLHNGIDLSAFDLPATFSRTEQRAALGLPADVPVVMTLAILREGKGHDTLLAAVPRILRQMPETRFLIVGGGPLEQTLRAQACDRGLSGRVIFTGMRQDVAQLLAAADVFALLSQHEPLPTVILEAMAMRLPVVACDSGGVPEMVMDGQTGVLVRSADPADVAQSILTLLAHPEEAVQMGRQGRARVEAQFGAASWTRQLESRYREASGQRRLRVAVIEFLGHGGLIHYAYQLCQALAAQDMDVTLVTDQAYELADRPHPFAVKQLFKLWNPRPAGQVKWSGSLRARCGRLVRRAARGLCYYREWWRLISYLWRERPDVVQFGDIRFATDFLPLALLRLSGLRVSDICHNIAPFDTRSGSADVVVRSPLVRLLYRWVYGCCDEIFVHSPDHRREFLRLYGGDPGRVRVIPHGNEQLFLQCAPQHVNGNGHKQPRLPGAVPEHAPVVLFFGTLTKYKGLEYLLEAFARVKRDVPDAWLVIAGYPNPETDPALLRAQAAALGIGDSTLFHFQYIPNDEVAAWFTRADVVAFPYLMVYQSGALQVAYSFGKPVVATNVGSFPDVIRQGENGFLVPPRDVKALAEALTAVLRDPVLARRLGRQARKDSETLYAWDRIAGQMRAAYAEACA